MTAAFLVGSLPTISGGPHQPARAGSGSGRPAWPTQSRVPWALPNHFPEKSDGIRMTVSSGKPHLEAEYTWWIYTPTTISNHWWLQTIIAKKPNYVSKTITLRKQCSIESVWSMSQRAYSTGQDRRQQMGTQRGAEKDEEMIKQFWCELVHGPNTPKKPHWQPNHHIMDTAVQKLNTIRLYIAFLPTFFFSS